MGKAAKQTNVISHPCTKAIINPEIKVPSTWIMTATFYPIAPWNVRVSEVKLLLSSDWFIQSNHPIYCLRRVAK